MSAVAIPTLIILGPAVAETGLLGLDKYAPYILGSYAATAVIFGGLVLWMLLRSARIRAELQSLEARREQALERASAPTPSPEKEEAAL